MLEMAEYLVTAATVIVLSNLAGIAVEFLFLLISQITGNPAIADLAFNPFINVVVCLLFMSISGRRCGRCCWMSSRAPMW